MKLTAAMSILLVMGASPVFADCTEPDESKVVIPSGAQATRDEMVAAQTAVKAFDTAVAAYSDCLKQDEDTKVAAGGDKAKVHAEAVKLNNEAVMKLQLIADKFNEELRAFKAKATQ
jgi:hypothetical protein